MTPPCPIEFHPEGLGGAEGIEAVDEGDADLDFCVLAFGVFCGDALTEGFEAPRLGLDPPSRMVSGPALPECFAVMPGGTQGFVSGDRGWAILLPRPPILTNWNDRVDLPLDDGRVAAARVVGTIGGHSAELFAPGNLVEQFR